MQKASDQFQSMEQEQFEAPEACGYYSRGIDAGPLYPTHYAPALLSFYSIQTLGPDPISKTLA